MEAIDYDKLADAVAEKINSKPPVPIEVMLWSVDDCSEYLKQARRTFAEKTSKHHTFPLSVNVPNGVGGKANSCWYAHEVINWVRENGR